MAGRIDRTYCVPGVIGMPIHFHELQRLSTALRRRQNLGQVRLDEFGFDRQQRPPGAEFPNAQLPVQLDAVLVHGVVPHQLHVQDLRQILGQDVEIRFQRDLGYGLHHGNVACLAPEGDLLLGEVQLDLSDALGGELEDAGLLVDSEGKDAQDTQQRQQSLALGGHDGIQIIDLQPFHLTAAVHDKAYQFGRCPLRGSLGVGVRGGDGRGHGWLGGGTGHGSLRCRAGGIGRGRLAVPRRRCVPAELASWLSRFARVAGAANGRGVALPGVSLGVAGCCFRIRAAGFYRVGLGDSERGQMAAGRARTVCCRRPLARDRRHFTAGQQTQSRHQENAQTGTYAYEASGSFHTYLVLAFACVSICLFPSAGPWGWAWGLSEADGTAGTPIRPALAEGRSGQVIVASFTTGCSRWGAWTLTLTVYSPLGRAAAIFRVNQRLGSAEHIPGGEGTAIDRLAGGVVRSHSPL